MSRVSEGAYIAAKVGIAHIRQNRRSMKLQINTSGVSKSIKTVPYVSNYALSEPNKIGH